MSQGAAEQDRVRRLVLGGDREPDPRFTLANERTFLAWIRTSLAVIAAGVATDALMVDLWVDGARRLIVVLLVVAGSLLAAGAGLRWLAVERALRRGRPLPMSPSIPLLSLVVLMGGVGVLALTL